MSDLTFKEIQSLAEDESERLRHFYLGVEHLFLALLRVPDGLATKVIKQHQLSPAYIYHLLLESLGYSASRRYWEGYHHTPRLLNVLQLAQNYADGETPDERDLLRAILSEGRSIPVRVLKSAGLDMAALGESVVSWSAQLPPLSTVEVDTELPLLALEKTLLQEMFQGHQRIRVEQEMDSGPVNARFYAVNSEHESATTIVKFDDVASIIREKRNYDTFVSDVLLPNIATTSITDFVISDHDNLGGLKYTFYQPDGQLLQNNVKAVDLRAFAKEHEINAVADAIYHRVYDLLRPGWWGQRERYRFGMWREYEMVLPPTLVVEAHAIRAGQIIQPLEEWSREPSIMIGSTVELQDFTVANVLRHRNSLELCAGPDGDAINYTSRVLVTGLEKVALDDYMPKQVVGSLSGQVVDTRQSLLLQYAEQLGANFDVAADVIETPLGEMANPIRQLPMLLQYEQESFMSAIHGTLHPGHIVLDVDDNAWLIDFSQTRFGHVLFDWAFLEVTLLESLVAPQFGGDWPSLWEVGRVLQVLSGEREDVATDVAGLDAVMSLIGTLRRIAGGMLAIPDDGREYYVALACIGLSCLARVGSPLSSRRLAYLASLLAVDEFRRLNA